MLAVPALVGGVITGLQSRDLVFVAPVADGQPTTTSVVYDPPMMLLTWVLITAAGVLAVLGVAGLVRARRARAVPVLKTPASVPPAPEPS
ncbi:hypothetical protein ORI20_23430 [Mycobacterium sp. CVI_P3]|uniref:Transmembrane protein n=2 Tax=Mycobacterium pinniadriaticum TaxID=2994102 RepID=A0ABT3SJF0_9MYCO|nr:hypothetical protein [Mycobacterium pinniadriaticum]MCX2933228.1 hypothetical protein [Mycobacterium pinniadriaticum]MCX2939650.1 hypothetical protein [Mycobacterium pinniadriaticum]